MSSSTSPSTAPPPVSAPAPPPPPSAVAGGAPPARSASSGSVPCCETGRPVIADPHTGQTVCSCQLSPPPPQAPGLLPPAGLPPTGLPPTGLPPTGLAYPKIPGLPEGLYNQQYAAAAAAAAAQGFLSLSPGAPGVDPSAFYPAMVSTTIMSNIITSYSSIPSPNHYTPS